MKATYSLTVKKEITAQESGFCACCGNRYEAGATMVLLSEAPNARGRIAHASCVAKNNARAEKAAAKFDATQAFGRDA